MKKRWAVFVGLGLLVIAAGYLVSAVNHPAEAAESTADFPGATISTVSAGCAADQAADRDVAGTNRVHCPCILGVNCCGDNVNRPTKCGKNLQCPCAQCAVFSAEEYEKTFGSLP